MVIFATLLVLALVGTLAALVALSVTAGPQPSGWPARPGSSTPTPRSTTGPGPRWTARSALSSAAANAARDRQARSARAENRLSWALGAIADGVVIFDNGEIVYRNDPAASFLAARHSDALVEEAITTMASDAAGPGGEAQLELFGPPRRVLSVRAVPLEGPTRPSGVLVVEDTSERRRLENVRRDFVANISHELKTQWGALRAAGETLLDEKDRRSPGAWPSAWPARRSGWATP